MWPHPRPVRDLDELRRLDAFLARALRARPGDPRFDSTPAWPAEAPMQVLVCGPGDVVLGGASGRLQPSPTLRAIAVAPPHRRRGLGSALVAAVIDGARTLGAPRLALGCRESVTGFYRRLGFAPLLMVQFLQMADGTAEADRAVEALRCGVLARHRVQRHSYDGVPQVLVTLAEVDPALRARVAAAVPGAHVGWIMLRDLVGRDDQHDPDGGDRAFPC